MRSDLQPLISEPREDLADEYKTWLDLDQEKGKATLAKVNERIVTRLERQDSGHCGRTNVAVRRDSDRSDFGSGALAEGYAEGRPSDLQG